MGLLRTIGGMQVKAQAMLLHYYCFLYYFNSYTNNFRDLVFFLKISHIYHQVMSSPTSFNFSYIINRDIKLQIIKLKIGKQIISFMSH